MLCILLSVLPTSIGVTWSMGKVWSAAVNQRSVDEANREISSQGLLCSVLSQARRQTKRANLKKWLDPDTFGDWSPEYTTPTKPAPRDITSLGDIKLLSPMID